MTCIYIYIHYTASVVWLIHFFTGGSRPLNSNDLCWSLW